MPPMDLTQCAGSTEKLQVQQQSQKPRRVAPVTLQPRKIRMNLIRTMLPPPQLPEVAADSALATILPTVPAFLADDSQQVLALPATLGPKERAVVHTFAGALGLGHDSVGKGVDRHIELRKNDTVTSRVSATGYIGLTSDLVAAVQGVCQSAVPADLVSNQRERDSAPHITLINPQELKELEEKGQTRADVLAHFQTLEDSWRPVGIGRVQNESDEAVFVVVRWQELQELRMNLGFGAKDVHITLGFVDQDVHDVFKGEETIFGTIPDGLDECFRDECTAAAPAE